MPNAHQGSDAPAVCALPGCSKVIKDVPSGEARRYCCPAHRKIARKRRRDRRATPVASTAGRPDRSNAPVPAGVAAATDLVTTNGWHVPPAPPVEHPTNGAGAFAAPGHDDMAPAPARQQYRRLVPEPRPRWYRRPTRPFAARGFRRNRPRYTLPPLPSDPEWLRPSTYLTQEPRRAVIHVGRPTAPPVPAPAPAPPPAAAAPAAPAAVPPPTPSPAPTPAHRPAPMRIPAMAGPPAQLWAWAPAPVAPAQPPGWQAFAPPPRLEPSVEATQPIEPVTLPNALIPAQPPPPSVPEPAPPVPPSPWAWSSPWEPPPTPPTAPPTAPPPPPEPSRSAAERVAAWARAAWAWCAPRWAAMTADGGVLARPHAALTQFRTARQQRRAATEADRRDAEAVLRGAPLPGEPVVEPKRRKRRPQPVAFQAAENSALAGQMREALLAALHSLTMNKLRSLLTTVGIVVGVAAVIVLVALGNGMKASFDAEFGKLANQITILPAKSSSPAGQASRNLTDRDVKALGDHQRAPHVAAISPAIVGNVPVSVGQNKDKATLVGAQANYLELLNRRLSAGQWFTDAQISSGARTAIIGQESVNLLFGYDTDPHQVLGTRIRLGHSVFTIQGVLAPDGQNDKAAIVPFDAARAHLVGDRGGKIDMIIVKSTSPATVQQATSEVIRILDQQHNIHQAADRDFNAQNFTELLRKNSQYVNFLTMFIVAVAAISLFVGGIGVANIMLVAVTERTREIGIRKAIGAKTTAILRQFLSEAVMLTGLGGLIGIVLGLGITQAGIMLLPRFGAGDPDSQIPLPVMSLEPVVIAFVVSLVIGVVAGGYPANRAARLRPIEALRFE
ncbi:ABC transporter permease [Pseudonocardia acaciae]|uniref:ABC transporter permease n=1 Tax=Pseudonocardia acaciae TaxID=551276 RepID=UPI000B2F4254|nr:ABC transporter permease [Pseudonocardia acaciae]